MNLFQAGPAETTDYMILGLAAVFVPMTLHIWSLFQRAKRLREDLEMIQDTKK